MQVVINFATCCVDVQETFIFTLPSISETKVNLLYCKEGEQFRLLPAFLGVNVIQQK